MEVSKLKVLLGLRCSDKRQDARIQFIIDDVTETICNYCNVKTLPSGLTNTAYRMAVDLYRSEGLGEASALIQVTSVKTGDTSTSFAIASDSLKGGILKNYRAQLNRYRRLPR